MTSRKTRHRKSSKSYKSKGGGWFDWMSRGNTCPQQSGPSQSYQQPVEPQYQQQPQYQQPPPDQQPQYQQYPTGGRGRRLRKRHHKTVGGVHRRKHRTRKHTRSH